MRYVKCVRYVTPPARGISSRDVLIGDAFLNHRRGTGERPESTR
jgi:hypothetical protein